MENVGEISFVPIIVLCAYILGEIYKIIFKTKEGVDKFLPVFYAIIGGLLGVVIYYTSIDTFKGNIWNALEIGLLSGFSLTGSSEMIKKIITKKNTNEKEKANDEK